ncbi:hypothetical protein ABPG74_007143 [Tetrahymena malaccensis]
MVQIESKIYQIINWQLMQRLIQNERGFQQIHFNNYKLKFEFFVRQNYFRMKKTTIASHEGNQKNLDFTLQRLEIYKSQIDSYGTQQQQIDEKDLKLLNLVNLERISNNYENYQAGNRNKNESQLLKSVNFVKQKYGLLKKIRSKIEKDLLLDDELNQKNGLSDDQVKEAQLKEISQEPDKYSNLVLNLDYKLKLNKQFRSENDYDVEQWFVLQKADYTTQIHIYAQSSNQIFYRWIQIFQNKNEYQHLCLYIHNLETQTDYFNFDDFISTLKLSEICFQTVTIDVQFENNLCILALLRTLLSINRFNILKIKNSISFHRKKIHLYLVGDLIQSIFRLIFSHRHLQGIQLEIPPESFDYLHSIAPQISMEKSQLRIFCSGSDYKFSNPNKVADYFQFLAQIPHLAHISQYAIPLRTIQAASILNTLLAQVQSACLHLIPAPPLFNQRFFFSNLKQLNLELGINPNTFTDQNLENLLLSLKEAKALAVFKLYFYNCIYYTSQESSKIQDFNQTSAIITEDNNQTKEKTHQNEQSHQEIKDKLPTLQKETLYAIHDLKSQTNTPIEKLNSLKFFDNLSELTELQDLNVTVYATQEIYDSLHRLLTKLTSLKNFYIKLNSMQNQNQTFDLGNIYQTLNNLQQISVNIETESINISYLLLNEYSNFYQFVLKLSQKQNEIKQVFNQYQFQLQSVQKIKIIQKNLENLENLNILCQSLSSCKSLKNLQLIVHLNGIDNSLNTIQRKPINKPELPFFKQFGQLNQLKDIYIDCIIDQHILDTISELLEKCQLIQTFILKKQNLSQYYLDYSNIFKSLQKLVQLNQVYISYQQEQLQISDQNKQKWEQHKLNTFYIPLCEFIRESSQTLYLIDLNQQQISEQPLKIIFQSLIDSKFHHYLRINPHLSYQIKSDYQKYEDILKACEQKGVLVKEYFKFPLSQPTGAYYDQNKSDW